MKPAARIQAAIEVIGEIIGGDAPAERVLRRFFRARRYAGSKDRAAISELVYDVLRHRGRLDWHLDGAGSPRLFVAGFLLWINKIEPYSIFSDEKYAPSSLTTEEQAVLSCQQHGEPPDWARLNLPAWLWPMLAGHGAANLAALNARAPLDLRVNSLKASRGEVIARLAAEGIEAHETPLAATGLRLAAGALVSASQSWRDGLVEVQDEGSQLAVARLDVRPGMTVLDYCAGAGGKSLALAAAMDNRGRIFAHDAAARRLARLAPRLARAGADIVQTGLPEGPVDLVLVDAPCSGSGTWRRNPNAAWRLTPARLAELGRLQAAVLDAAAEFVRPGGRLAYVTCSLLASENDDQVEGFLARHNDFRRRSAELLTPWRHGVDGFFIALLDRPHR